MSALLVAIAIALAAATAPPRVEPCNRCSDLADVRDLADPPSAGGSLVVRSRVAWDANYDVPKMHRRGAWKGGWAAWTSKQREYRRRGVR